MILQIDHVAFACTDIEKKVRSLKGWGYQDQFVEAEISNPLIKRSLMRRFSQKQTMVLMRNPGSFAVELLDHGHVNEQHGSFTPIVENFSKDFVKSTSGHKICGQSFEKALCLSLDCEMYFTESEKFQFNKVVLKTNDLKASVKFWKNFGFQVASEDLDGVILKFRSLISPSDLYIYLQSDKSYSSLSYLDDQGFNCLAFISNAVEREKENLEAQGFVVTGIEELKVNQKRLSVCFAQGPCGECAEIIGIAKG